MLATAEVEAPQQEQVIPTTIPQPPAPTSTAQEIVRAKTIEVWGEQEWGAMHELVQKESGWQPTVYNRQGSGACGLFQSLPCSKVLSVAGSLENIEGQAQWGVDYIKSRYGSPSKALHFWKHEAPKMNGHNWY